MRVSLASFTTVSKDDSLNVITSDAGSVLTAENFIHLSFYCHRKHLKSNDSRKLFVLHKLVVSLVITFA